MCAVHSYICSKQTPLQVDFVSYMDEIAGMIGARPSLPWLFFTDYPLFKRVLWGPVTCYQYRIMGPGKWSGARHAIFTQFDRMYQPLKTRPLDESNERSLAGRLFKLSLVSLVGASAVYYLHQHPPASFDKLISVVIPQKI